MPVSVTIRKSDSGPVLEITLDELKEQIRERKLGPTTQINDNYWTGGQWWTLNNLKVFHRCSPDPHEPGIHLAKKLHLQAERDAQQRERIKWQQHVLNSLPEDFRERCCGTLGLAALRLELGCIGIARLTEKPAFAGPGLITVRFNRDCIHVDFAKADQQPASEVSDAIGSPWKPLPDWSRVAESFAANHVTKWASADIQASELPEILRDWKSLSKTAQIAGDCQSYTLDGVGFVHELADSSRHHKATWSNPIKSEHPLQVALILAYRSLVPSAFKRMLYDSDDQP